MNDEFIKDEEQEIEFDPKKLTEEVLVEDDADDLLADDDILGPEDVEDEDDYSYDGDSDEEEY